MRLVFHFWLKLLGARTPLVVAFTLLTGYVANACADSEVAQFVKQCQVYRNSSSSQDFGTRLEREKQKLANHGVPIKLLLHKCDSLRFRISLPSGKFTDIEVDYPKVEDPDAKGFQYSWDPKSPSSDYWLFRFFAWEWSGWRLVHKKTGRSFETVTECADAPIAVRKGLLATICSGAYENVIPTLYIASFSSSEIRWSGGLPLANCKAHEAFGLEDMRFVNAVQLNVRGYCSESESRSAGGNEQIFTLSPNGISTKQHGSVVSVEWK